MPEARRPAGDPRRSAEMPAPVEVVELRGCPAAPASPPGRQAARDQRMEIADQPEQPLPAPPGRRLEERRAGSIELELAAGVAGGGGGGGGEGGPPPGGPRAARPPRVPVRGPPFTL